MDVCYSLEGRVKPSGWEEEAQLRKREVPSIVSFKWIARDRCAHSPKEALQLVRGYQGEQVVDPLDLLHACKSGVVRLSISFL